MHTGKAVSVSRPVIVHSGHCHPHEAARKPQVVAMRVMPGKSITYRVRSLSCQCTGVDAGQNTVRQVHVARKLRS